jgi:hypothetical protein
MPFLATHWQQNFTIRSVSRSNCELEGDRAKVGRRGAVALNMMLMSGLRLSPENIEDNGQLVQRQLTHS